MNRTLWLWCCVLVSCSGPTSVPAPEPETPTPPVEQPLGCVDESEMIDGIAPTPADPAIGCESHFADDEGDLLRVTRELDAQGRVVAQTNQRLDQPRRFAPFFGFGRTENRSLERFEYDAAGRPTLHTVDDEIDGSIDLSERWSFDEAGRLLRSEDESAGSRSLVINRYDANGELLSAEWSSNGVHSLSRTWQRRPDGKPSTLTEVDPGGRVTVTTWHYDEQGRLRSQTMQPPNEGPASVVTFDEHERMVERRSDWDGVRTLIHQLEYDARGNTLRDHRFVSDGSEVEDTQQTFDADDHLLTRLNTFGFSLAAGPITTFDTNTWGGPCGRKLTSERRRGGERVERSFFTWDARGRQLGIEFRRGALEASRSLTSSRFDDAGHLVERRLENWLESAWQPVQQRQLTLDVAGRVLIDESKGGTISRREAHTYDERGRELTAAHPGNLWGNPSYTVRHVYTCQR